MKSWFFKKVNKIDKPLTNLTRRRREKIKTNGDEKENIKTNTNEIQRIMREYFENLYSINWIMNKFIDTFDQPKLNE
jgi:hypothetical protein